MNYRIIKSFGRRHGKTIRPYQKSLMNNVLPKIAPDKIESNKTILEIGFGAGEHLIHLAKTYSDFNIIGAEPFLNGVASCLSKIESENPDWIESKHVQIFPDDIKLLFDNNPDFKFDLIYILHPDPWPKARHEKRRLMNTDFLNLISSHIKNTGFLIFGTDHTDLFNWTLEQVEKSQLKKINQNNLIPPTSGLKTRYKEKNMFGSEQPSYAVFTHLDSDLPKPEDLAIFDLNLE